MSEFLRAACCLVLFCAASIAAFGQVSTATAFGKVTDSTGAVIRTQPSFYPDRDERSGKPFRITSGNDDNKDGVNNDRPNVEPGKVPSVLGKTSEWFDTSAYCRVGTGGCPAGGGPSGLDGLVRVNSLDGPEYKNVDASIFRDFTIKEGVRLQFRGEATNVLNHVNLNNPGGTLSSTSSFGVITGASPMRVLQVGARLLF